MRGGGGVRDYPPSVNSSEFLVLFKMIVVSAITTLHAFFFLADISGG